MRVGTRSNSGGCEDGIRAVAGFEVDEFEGTKEQVLGLGRYEDADDRGGLGDVGAEPRAQGPGGVIADTSARSWECQPT